MQDLNPLVVSFVVTRTTRGIAQALTGLFSHTLQPSIDELSKREELKLRIVHGFLLVYFNKFSIPFILVKAS